MALLELATQARTETCYGFSICLAKEEFDSICRIWKYANLATLFMWLLNVQSLSKVTPRFFAVVEHQIGQLPKLTQRFGSFTLHSAENVIQLLSTRRQDDRLRSPECWDLWEHTIEYLLHRIYAKLSNYVSSGSKHIEKTNYLIL